MAFEAPVSYLESYAFCANESVCQQRVPVWLLGQQKGLCTKCAAIFGVPLARARNKACDTCGRVKSGLLFKCPVHHLWACAACAQNKARTWPNMMMAPLDPLPEEPAGLGALGSIATWITTNNKILEQWSATPQAKQCLLCTAHG